MQAFDHFCAVAKETHKKTDSFRGIDGEASASIEMRKRSVASTLTEEEVETLERLGIKSEKVIKTPKLYAINPAYASDDALMSKVEKALTKALKDIVDVDNFFVVQEEVSKSVVTDETIEAVFKNQSDNQDLIYMVTTLAVKPSLKNFSVEKALKLAVELTSSVESEETHEEKVA